MRGPRRTGRFVPCQSLFLTPAADSFSYFDAHLACILFATKTPSRPSWPSTTACARSTNVSGGASLPTYFTGRVSTCFVFSSCWLIMKLMLLPSLWMDLGTTSLDAFILLG